VSQTRVAIIASGGANIASLKFALERLNIESELSADGARIRSASHVILPGVGAAADAMARLRASGLDRVIPALKQPVLGICLGMQLLFDSSAEGDAECLKILPGRAERFVNAPGLPVPHMGWNTLQIEAESALLAGLDRSKSYAYFVHSFSLEVSGATIATCTYGRKFSACVQRDNFFGVQFHPERSALVGAQILKNFVSIH
jgi:glutamine amidotransferase